MDFRSRDRYRHAVEELAAPTGEAQLLLALKSVERARQTHAESRPSARGARRLSPDRRRAAGSSSGASAGGRPSDSASAALFFALATPGYLGRSPPGTGAAGRPGRRLCACDTAGAACGLLVAGTARTLVPASELTIQIAAAADQLPDSAAPAAAARARRAFRTSARTMVIVPTMLDSVERVQDLHRAPRSAGARQRRPAHPLRAAQRLPRRRRPRRCRSDAEILEAARAGIAALNAKHADGGSRSVLPVPPPAAVERARRPLDGMGAQARQDRGVQPPAARRHRHELRGHGRRPVDPAARHVLHHARQRHAAAARRRRAS